MSSKFAYVLENSNISLFLRLSSILFCIGFKRSFDWLTQFDSISWLLLISDEINIGGQASFWLINFIASDICLHSGIGALIAVLLFFFFFSFVKIHPSFPKIANFHSSKNIPGFFFFQFISTIIFFPPANQKKPNSQVRIKWLLPECLGCGKCCSKDTKFELR